MCFFSHSLKDSMRCNSICINHEVQAKIPGFYELNRLRSYTRKNCVSSQTKTQKHLMFYKDTNGCAR